MSRIKTKNTTPELFLRRALSSAGIRGYRLHWRKAPGRPDICWPSKKIAIFVHGCFWHRCPYCKLTIPKSNSEFWKKKFQTNKARDKSKIKLLEDNDWTVLVVWECRLKDSKELNGLIKLISRLFSESSAGK